MSEKTLSEAEFEKIVRESCEKPFSPDVIVVDGPDPTEKDYLHAVWSRVAKYVEWELPAMPAKYNPPDAEMYRDDIVRLVSGHQSGNYDIRATLHKYISAALDESGNKE